MILPNVRRLLVTLLVILTLVCLATPASGQSAAPASQQPLDVAHPAGRLLNFSHITAEHGLSDERIWALLQDQSGFMWFGSNNGLHRFDGYDMVVYRHDDSDPNSLSGNVIQKLYQDSGGTMWVGTRSGLNAFDRRSNRFTNYRHDRNDPRSLSSDVVFDIYEDRSGTLWIATDGGLNRFDRTEGSFIAYRHDPKAPNSLSHDTVRAIQEDREGVLWLGTFGGLDKFDRSSEAFTHYRHDPANPQSLSHDGVYDLYEDRSGTLWITTNGGGINRLNRADETFIAYRHDPDDPHSLSDDRVDNIIEDASGKLWIGTFGGGVSILDEARQEFTNSLYDPGRAAGLSHSQVMDIYIDRSGLIWLATNGSGVDLYNPQQLAFAVYNHQPDVEESIASDLIFTVYEDRNGILWIGTQDHGLDRWDRQTGQITHYPPDAANPQRLGFPFVSAIAEDPTGMLWVGTYGGGLYRLDPGQGLFTAYRHDPANPRGLSHNSIVAMRVDRSGAIWIGTNGGGLNRLDPATGDFTLYRHDPANPQSLSSDGVWAIAEDRSGILWIGTLGGGLNRLDPTTGNFTRYSYDPTDPASLSDDNIYDIHIDRAGLIWIGSYGGGLNRLDPATGDFIRYREEDGLSSDRVISLLEDGSPDDAAPGNLWIVTGRGLSKLDRDRESFHTYDTVDGLPRSEYSRGHAQSRSGELVVGTSKGVIVFDPALVQDDPHVPPVVFTEFLLANELVDIGGDSVLKQAIDDTEALTLPYTDRILSIKFAGLSYRAPRQNRYRYMLEGFDTEWIEVDSSRRLVTYTNLDPGRYVFRVAAANHDGVWNEAGRALELTVVPPWWQTLWARTMLGGLALAGAVGGYRYRVHAIERRNQQLERQVMARTQELGKTNLQLQREMGERLAAEQALQASQDRYAMATRAANVSVWEWDLVTDAFYLDPSAKAMLGYGDTEIKNTFLGWKALVYPADLERMVAFVQSDGARAHEHYVHEHRMLHRDGSAPWVRMDGTLIRDEQGRARRMIGTLRDITASKQAQLTLQETNAALNRRLEELSTLNSIAQMITTAADRRGVLDTVSEALGRLFSATGVEISLFNAEGSQLAPVARYPRVDAESAATAGPSFDDASDSLSADASFIRAVQEGNSLILSGAFQSPEVAQSVKIVRELNLQALMVAPLAVRGAVLGLAAVGSDQPDNLYTTSELELLETIVGQIAGDIEALRLLDKERTLRQMAEYHEREMATLLQIAEHLASTLELNPLLEEILNQVEAVVPCTVSTIMSLEEEELKVLAYHGPMPKGIALQQSFPGSTCEFLFADDGAQFMAVGDLTRAPEVLAGLKQLFGSQFAQFMGRSRSWASVPLDGSTGRKSVIMLGHRKPNRFSETDRQFISAVAGHAAVAIENAQLYRHARINAAYEERNRLARELHDAVTQTLFAANLIADTLLDSWERSPEITRQGLGELQQLTHGALVEMRTLLLELRPEAMMKKPLGELIHSLADAFTSRTKIPVDLRVSGKTVLPPNVQISLYRIAQEALNNISKHAQAQSVKITLNCEAATVMLSIADDGRGFDQQKVPLDRMGLSIIRERAQAIGAECQIRSGNGIGTTITVNWSGLMA
jgi:PAS domain S-box-containing protein